MWARVRRVGRGERRVGESDDALLVAVKVGVGDELLDGWQIGV